MVSLRGSKARLKGGTKNAARGSDDLKNSSASRFTKTKEWQRPRDVKYVA